MATISVDTQDEATWAQQLREAVDDVKVVNDDSDRRMQLERLNESLEQLKVLNEGADSHAERMQAALESQLEKATEELNNLQSITADHMRRTMEVKGKNEQLRSQLRSTIDKLHSEEASNLNQYPIIKTFESEVGKLEVLRNTSEDCGILRSRLEMKNKAFDAQQLQLASTIQRLDQVFKERDSMKLELFDLPLAKNDAARFKQKLHDVMVERDQLEYDLGNVTRQLQRATSESEQKNDDIATANRQFHQQLQLMKEQLGEAIAEKGRIQREWSNSYTQLHKDNDDLERVCTRLRSERSSLNQQLQEKDRRHQQDRGDTMEEIRMLKEQLAEAQSARSPMKRKKARTIINLSDDDNDDKNGDEEDAGNRTQGSKQGSSSRAQSNVSTSLPIEVYDDPIITRELSKIKACIGGTSNHESNFRTLDFLPQSIKDQLILEVNEYLDFVAKKRRSARWNAPLNGNTLRSCVGSRVTKRSHSLDGDEIQACDRCVKKGRLCLQRKVGVEFVILVPLPHDLRNGVNVNQPGYWLNGS